MRNTWVQILAKEEKLFKWSLALEDDFSLLMTCGWNLYNLLKPKPVVNVEYWRNNISAVRIQTLNISNSADALHSSMYLIGINPHYIAGHFRNASQLCSNNYMLL